MRCLGAMQRFSAAAGPAHTLVWCALRGAGAFVPSSCWCDPSSLLLLWSQEPFGRARRIGRDISGGSNRLGCGGNAQQQQQQQQRRQRSGSSSSGGGGDGGGGAARCRSLTTAHVPSVCHHTCLYMASSQVVHYASDGWLLHKTSEEAKRQVRTFNCDGSLHAAPSTQAIASSSPCHCAILKGHLLFASCMRLCASPCTAPHAA